MIHKHIFLILFSLLCIQPAKTQVTSSSMNGSVSGDGEKLAGATVTATHLPSGTRYGTITNASGFYNMEGMRVGGPYNIEISYIGFKKAIYQDIRLNLSEAFQLDVVLQPSIELEEVVVTAGKHMSVKTGASTLIKEDKWLNYPNISRSMKDLVALSPYAQGVRLGGRDQRQNNFTVDGANFNFNMGLDGEVLPANGTPISIDALEEIQVSIAPFDVRQSHFVGGSVNAITKSGTNQFKGSAYTYLKNENMRGNKIDGFDLGERPKERKNLYGFTLGGPILKDKLFFFVNGEYEHQPAPIYKWQPSTDGIQDPQNYISRTTAEDMQAFKDILINRYGYNPGSFTDFNGVNDTYRTMARLDWNISDRHKLMFRYNYSSNKQDRPVVGAAHGVSGAPMSAYSMTFWNSCWSNNNSIHSWTTELNSRLGTQLTNQLLASYTLNSANKRKGNGREFPTIDILKEDETGISRAYMNAGYDQHAWRNGIDEKTWSITNNLTYNYNNHNFIAGLSYESTIASNCYMRYGAGYYRYNSLEDFANGTAPSAFGICYSLTGEDQALSTIHYDEFSVYLQDNWTIDNRLKLFYGLRMDIPFYINNRYANEAIEKYDFNGISISTANWPESRPLFAPRIGFVYDILGDHTIKLRGGTGIFNGRFPLIFLSKMQEASGVLQFSYLPATSIKNPDILNALQGGVRERNEVIKLLKEKFPDKFPDAQETSVSNIATISDDFKMPQVWKNSLAVDYQLPIPFPADLTLEVTYTKDLNAIIYKNVNILPENKLEHFDGPDNRYIYPDNRFQYKEVNNAILMDNCRKGYSYTLNATVNTQPVPNLHVMAAYTFTRSRVMSNNKSNQVDNAWAQEPSVNGSNFLTLHASSYMQSPHRLIAQISYDFEWLRHANTQISLFYEGMRGGNFSYMYANDMNNDGALFDLMYIPASKDELTFKEYTINQGKENEIVFTAKEQADAFWKYVNQDPYLKNKKGKYAGAYETYLPWVHRFNLRFVQDIHAAFCGTKNKIQLSLDILNLGNLFKSSWGVTKSAWSGGKLLSYQGKTEDNEPVYTFNTITDNGTIKLPTESFYNTRDTQQCWSMQIGIRYIFN